LYDDVHPDESPCWFRGVYDCEVVGMARVHFASLAKKGREREGKGFVEERKVRME